MKSASAILRIVFGLAVVAFAFFTYHQIIPHVEAGEAVQLFGHPVNPTAWSSSLTLMGWADRPRASANASGVNPVPSGSGPRLSRALVSRVIRPK